MEQKRRLNDATPQEWTEAYYEVMRLEREKRQQAIYDLEKGLNGTSYDDLEKLSKNWDDWKPNRDLG